MVLKQDLQSLGHQFKRAEVGDKFVSTILSKEGWALEAKSFWSYNLQRSCSTGDGTIAAKTIVSLLLLDKQPKDILKHFQKIPQINKSIKVTNKDIVMTLMFETAVQDIETDLAVNRVLCRPSGTVNKVGL